MICLIEKEEENKKEMAENPKNIMLVCKECSEKMYPDKGKFQVDIGQFAKLKFTDKSCSEYMWVKVVKVRDGQDYEGGYDYEGMLDNEPIFVRNVEYGDVVKFNKQDILDVTT